MLLALNCMCSNLPLEVSTCSDVELADAVKPHSAPRAAKTQLKRLSWTLAVGCVSCCLF